MVRSVAMRSEMMPCEIQQFSTYLNGCQVEKMPDRFDTNLGQSTMKPDHRVLENVIGLLPPPKLGKAVKHLLGEPEQSVASVKQ
jgi:hypothetical protein